MTHTQGSRSRLCPPSSSHGCSGPIAAATSALWGGAPSCCVPPPPPGPHSPCGAPPGVGLAAVHLPPHPLRLPPPAPAGDSSSGHPPSPARPLAVGPARAPLTLAAPWAPREPEHQVGLCLLQKSYRTYLSSPPRSAPTPGKQTRMESHGAAQHRCPQPGARPAVTGGSSTWVAKAGFLAFGNETLPGG